MIDTQIAGPITTAQRTWHHASKPTKCLKAGILAIGWSGLCRRQISKYRGAHPLHGRFLCTSRSEPHRFCECCIRSPCAHHNHIALRVALKELPISRRLSPPTTLLFAGFAETLNVFVITPLPRKLVPTSFVPRRRPLATRRRRLHLVAAPCAWTSSIAIHHGSQKDRDQGHQG
jgi:hypothetical protein